jgi:hypothetical protein
MEDVWLNHDLDFVRICNTGNSEADSKVKNEIRL